jgi:HemY protein
MARASRAPRDAVWMADGVIAANWAPASPVTGRLDAFVWQQPAERLGAEIPYAPAASAEKDWTLDWVQAGGEVARPPSGDPAELVQAGESAEEEKPEASASAVPAAEKETARAELAPSVTPKPATENAAAAAHGSPAIQKVVFPLSGAPDDPGLEDLDKRKKRADFFSNGT